MSRADLFTDFNNNLIAESNNAPPSLPLFNGQFMPGLLPAYVNNYMSRMSAPISAPPPSAPVAPQQNFASSFTPYVPSFQPLDMGQLQTNSQNLRQQLINQSMNSPLFSQLQGRF